jgi:type III pantothenate kinase
MLLTIDIGNTNISFGLFEGDELKKVYSFPTEAESWQKKLSKMRPEGVGIASVVPSLNRKVCELLKREPLFVSYEDIETDLENPSEAGADRIANAIAAKTLYTLPAIILDFGTATTADVISEDGVYLGGVIMPGAELSLSALFEKAELVKPIEPKPIRSVIGKSTEEAVSSGFFYGTAAQTDGIVRRIKNELKGSPVVIATGGLSEKIAPFSSEIDRIDPYLTLYGIMRVYSLKGC